MEEELKSLQAELEKLEKLQSNQMFQRFLQEMWQKVQGLYLESMSQELTDSQRVHKLEQQRGVAFAMDWFENTKRDLQQKIDILKGDYDGESDE